MVKHGWVSRISLESDWGERRPVQPSASAAKVSVQRYLRTGRNSVALERELGFASRRGEANEAKLATGQGSLSSLRFPSHTILRREVCQRMPGNNKTAPNARTVEASLLA